MDIWVAPLATAVYSTATYRQPFWIQLHTLIMNALDTAQNGPDNKIITQFPLSDEDARSLCFLMMATLFTFRALYSFRLPSTSPEPTPQLYHTQSTKRCK